MRLLLILLTLLTQFAPAPAPRLIVLGDSIGAGQGASDAAHGYAAIVASQLGRTLDNRVIGGTTIDQQPIPTDLRPGDVVVWLSGYNDMRAGNDPVAYGRALRAAVMVMVAQGATVYVGLCLPMTEAGYTAYGPRWNHGSDSLVAAYQAQLPGGVRIAYDAANVTADLVHPNDTGHAQIARSFLAAIIPPSFTARLDSPGAATIQWNQQARGCLWEAPSTFVDCYDGARHVVVTLGHQGPLDGVLRPELGTVYILRVDGVVYRAPTRRAVYFPVWR